MYALAVSPRGGISRCHSGLRAKRWAKVVLDKPQLHKCVLAGRVGLHRVADGAPARRADLVAVRDTDSLRLLPPYQMRIHKALNNPQGPAVQCNTGMGPL